MPDVVDKVGCHTITSFRFIERSHTTISAGCTGKAIAAYVLLGGVVTLYEELLPIFCKENVQHKGLGMNTQDIGSMLTVRLNTICPEMGEK